ncbi:MAG: transcriptional regulator NrdR [Armatimonadetes bacterium]|jgi:transcriptional repressor NrdR|nr:transcriptional regulator NrdR [Armatimonadota bacterium]
MEDKVLDSRVARDGDAIKRRRECLGCGRRFTTFEHIEERRVRVVKKDGRREPFDRQKILRGLDLACRKRPVSSETIERVAEEIERTLYDRGEQEVQATVIGEMIIEALRGLDPVAYVRFASVYRDFQDLTQFQELLELLKPGAKGRGRAGSGRRPTRKAGKENGGGGQEP